MDSLCLVADEPTTSDWAGQILKGISKLKCPSSIPNNLMVYGDNAQVVLTANFDPRFVIMAAAEYEKGRVVVSVSSEFGLANDASVSVSLSIVWSDINQCQQNHS